MTTRVRHGRADPVVRMFARRSRLSRTAALSLLVLGGSIAAQSNVLVVDRSGAGEFLQIQDAVLAAQEGDTILVRPPSPVPVYDAIDVRGKALTIVADSTTQLAGLRGIRVRDLAPGQTVVLAGLHANSQGIGIPPGNPALWLHDNEGSVRLVGCTSNGYGSYASPGLAIESSSRGVALARCALIGGAGVDGDESEAGPGGPGLLLRDANAVAFDSTFVGGRGGALWIPPQSGSVPGAGGIGAMLQRVAGPTALLTLNTSIIGGPGGKLPFCLLPPFVGGAGGTGLVVGSSTVALGLDSSLAGGAGGSVTGCGGPAGPAGTPFTSSGHLSPVAGPHLAFHAPTVAREGQVITLSFQGTPGDRVFLIEGRETTMRLLWGGALVVKPPRVRREPEVSLGTIQPDGLLSVAYPLLAVATGAIHLWLQAYAVHGGTLRMGGFSVVTVLDSIY